VHIFSRTPALSADNKTVIDPEYIVTLCAGKTALQVKALMLPYIGKILTITGHVSEMRDSEYSKELNVEIVCAANVTINAKFSSEDTVILTQVTRDMVITVQGMVEKLTYVGQLSIAQCTVLQIAKT
jgi:hypothetical protein